MTRRPTLDDLQAEQRAFIGPPPPPQIPKFTPASERQAVYQMMLEELIPRIDEESRWALKNKA